MTRASSQTADGLRTVVLSSIDQVPAENWDRVASRQGLFWTHRFFRALESSGVENASYHYVLVYDAESLVGTAVLSSFVVSLDLLLPRAVQKGCQLVRKLLPGFMRIKVLFCGVPISFGKHTIACAGKDYAASVVTRVASVMNDLAVRESIRYLCFKEFAQRDLTLCAPLEGLGYFRANSVPRVLLPIRWTSYQDYLRSMRHGYRRAILSSLQALGQKWRVWPPDEAPVAEDVYLRLDDGQRCSAGHFHELYVQVMSRTVVKLETLNARFFERLFAEMRNDVKLLLLEKGDRLLGAAVLANYQGTLTFLFVGFDYERRDEYAVYLNLLNGIVRYGIESGWGVIDLGQTSYWLKQRIGGQTEPMHFCLKCRSRWFHSLLKASRRFLFPQTSIPSLRVFRD